MKDSPPTNISTLNAIWTFLYDRRHRWASIASAVCMYFMVTNYSVGWSLAYGLCLTYALEPFFRSLK